MCKCKISNLHKVVFNFSCYNTRSISANKSFGSSGFVSNDDDQENTTLGTIYKSTNKISNMRTNIEYEQIKDRL